MPFEPQSVKGFRGVRAKKGLRVQGLGFRAFSGLEGLRV